MRPLEGMRTMAYLFSSESLSLSTILLTEWLGPAVGVKEALFPNCLGILLESWHGICLTYPQGLSYSSCTCGPRLLTNQAHPTLSCVVGRVSLCGMFRPTKQKSCYFPPKN
jgi:hypothetical protein